MRRHILDLDDWTSNDIEQVLAGALDTAHSRAPRTVATLFYEPSTRTRVSFELAARRLGADVVTIARDGSSIEKGESLLDTLRTLQALGIGAVALRYPTPLPRAEIEAAMTRTVIINAGDGMHAHPTQALADLLTVRHRLGRLDGLKVVIVGDVIHSRVANSASRGFRLMGGQVLFAGPGELLPDLAGCHTNLDRALEGADVVMALRLQRERWEQPPAFVSRDYRRDYGLTAERLARCCPEAIVMSPGPMNVGVEIDADVAYGPQSVIEAQVANGLAVRTALLRLAMEDR